MKRVLFALAASLACCAPLATYAADTSPRAAATPARESKVSWKTFVDQHGSSVDVPITLFDQVNDSLGLKFRGKHNASSIYFYTLTESRPGFPGHDPKGDMDLKRSDCDEWPPSYKVVKDSLSAFSCKKGGMVKYYVGRYNQSGLLSLYIEYPADQRNLWSGLVKRMSASMHQKVRSE